MKFRIRGPGLRLATSFMGVAATICCTGWASPCSASEPRHQLEVRIVPRFDGAPLKFDSLVNATAAGQKTSVSRLDFFLSELSVLNDTGSWIPLSERVAYIGVQQHRTAFQAGRLAEGHYKKLRFDVGLQPKVNHSDPAAYRAGHPLNPNVNGLHWGWMGGYVFLALEGHWLSDDGLPRGYSFHLATDRQLMHVEVPLDVALQSDGTLELELDLAKIFSAPNQVALNTQLASTHSRTNDVLAGQLRENIEHAFKCLGLVPGAVAQVNEQKRSRREIAPGAHAWRFTMSSAFPRPALPEDNPLTEEGVALGRRLFFDTYLSRNNVQSCASCHQPSAAFSDNRPFSTGADGKVGTRNAMPLMNLAWKSSYFWDGRAASLREQVLQPIQNPGEMNESLSSVVAKLTAGPTPAAAKRAGLSGSSNRALAANADSSESPYPSLFESAFGTPDITEDRIARALEQFLLVQTSFDSKFDRVLQGQETFTKMEQRGFELFHTEYDPRREQFGADCFHCHGGPLFQNQTFANNGLDQAFTDPGRTLVTGNEADQGKFSVPSLRNVELSAPYMHDGRFKNLEEVVEHYSSPLKRASTLDPNLAKHPDRGLELSTEDKQAIVAFLKTLTDERFRTNTPKLIQLADRHEH
jgi:cytochrome c peroxidase